MNDQVLFFGDVTPESEPLAGGKGGTLARLYRRGYPVPDGFVILVIAFVDDELKPEAWVQVRLLLERLRRGDGSTGFAVRSSAVAEDSARASFAGEFETVLDARTDEAVRSALRKVRQSRHSDRVRAYSEARGLKVDHEMAVIVQRLVRAEMSGVLFTADPITGSRNNMIGNYINGLGEQLVSGEARHHDFTLSRPKGRFEGPPDMKRFSGRLFKLAKRLERDLGRPQDIEWAIAQDDVYVIQARPITTMMGFDPVTGEFNDSLTGDYVWSSVNVGEAMSVVMTPFTWSIMRAAYDELSVVPGYASVGNIGGRPYQNITVMTSMLYALRKNIRDVSKEMGGVRDEYLETMDRYLFPLPEATFFAVLPNAIRVWRKERQGLKNLEAFVSDSPAWCKDVSQRIKATRVKGELASLFLNELKPRSIKTFWRTLATAFRYGEIVGKLRRELGELVGAEDADALLSNVSGHDELLASLGPVVGLAKVARGVMSRDAYFERWGHRGTFEIEASIPRPAEDPEWLDRQLATVGQCPVDAEALLAEQRARFDAAWERLQARHQSKSEALRRRLDRAADAIRIRETVRSELARLIWVARTWVLQVGELTGIGDDAFFLTVDELLDLLAGKDTSVAHIPARRRTHDRYKALPPYPPVIRGRFDPFVWAVDPNRRNDVFDSHGLLTELSTQASREDVIQGIPGSAGWAEGAVRRLDTPEEAAELQPGEILVAPQTNIGWTLLFPRARAVVTDVGAPLSHAAIVARELGIPAVVNCGDATRRLHTGDRVAVDGGKGVVTILNRTPTEEPS